MSLWRKFFEEVLVAFAADLLIGGVAVVAGWFFHDAILSMLGAYRRSLYLEYWYIVIVGVAIFAIQALLLVKFRTIAGFLWSIGTFFVFWIVYVAMLFPPAQPLIPEVHIHTVWRFSFHVVLMFQAGAIIVVGAVSVVLHARQKLSATR